MTLILISIVQRQASSHTLPIKCRNDRPGSDLVEAVGQRDRFAKRTGAVFFQQAPTSPPERLRRLALRRSTGDSDIVELVVVKTGQSAALATAINPGSDNPQQILAGHTMEDWYGL